MERNEEKEGREKEEGRGQKVEEERDEKGGEDSKEEEGEAEELEGSLEDDLCQLWDASMNSVSDSNLVNHTHKPMTDFCAGCGHVFTSTESC